MLSGRRNKVSAAGEAGKRLEQTSGAEGQSLPVTGVFGVAFCSLG
jgi:hypothetical protein